MELAQVLHMNGDVEEASYANNSLIQREAISLTTSLIVKAITNLYCSLYLESLAIADLGCSSGPNTLLVTMEIIKVVEKLCKEMNHKSPEYKVFLNDLSANDFNSLFKSLDNFNEKLCGEMKTEIGPCYFFGVSGSFYGRIFPNQSLHFVHSSYSLHWLSKVPKGVDNNKGNIYVTSTSPSNVLKAYYEQFQIDLSHFLKCRSLEIVERGCMILTLLGRESDALSSNGIFYVWELLTTALIDMVMQGIIKEEKLDTFNIPNYYPSPSEVQLEVIREGSFSIDELKVSEVKWNTIEYDKDSVVKSTKAVYEPLLISHFGKSITKQVFDHYGKILTYGISKERAKMTNITISLTRKPRENHFVFY